MAARGSEKIGTGAKPSAVLFFDDGDWDSFLQLAALLRRAGLATIRATTLKPGRAVSTLRTLFDYTVLLAGPSETARLDDIVAKYTIFDVQTTEPVARLAYDYANTLNSPHAGRWAARPAMIDKVAIARALSTVGIQAPETLLAAEATPEEAAEKLGLPLVIKHRVGSAGLGVFIVHTLAELLEVAALPGAEERFYEHFVAGEPIRFGCLATEAGVMYAGAWQVLQRVRPLAPATTIEFVDAPNLEAIGEAIVRATGMRGLLNLQFLIAADGSYWLHDVNPRAWGSFGAFAVMGHGIGAAYVDWLQGKPVDRVRIRPGSSARVALFPAALRVRELETATWGRFLPWLGFQRRTYGLGYLLTELVRNRQYLALRPSSPSVFKRDKPLSGATAVHSEVLIGDSGT